MTPVIILAILAIAPVVIMLLLRINAALVFLSLCVGAILVQYVAKDVMVVVGAFEAQQPGVIPDNSYVKLGLLFLPAILTMVFMLGTVKKGHSKMLVNLLPALGTGVLAASLAVPLLPLTTRLSVTSSEIWTQFQQYQGYAIALSATIVLITIWMQRPKHHGKHEEKHGKHKG